MPTTTSLDHNTPVIIQQFIDRIIQEKSLPNLDDDTLVRLKTDLTDRVENQINAAMVSALPPEYLPEFEQLLEMTSQDAVQKFCGTHIPNLPEVIAAALLRFRQVYLNA